MDPTIRRIPPSQPPTPRVEGPTDREGEPFSELLEGGEGKADEDEPETPERGDRSVSAPDEDEAGGNLDVTG